MVTVKVNISWCNKNYAAVVDKQVPGVVLVTHKTLDGIKKAVAEAVDFHKEGMLADGDEMPAWFADGDYRFEWILDVSAMLHSCERYTSIAALSRASGINERLLSHYANGLKVPREKQRAKIVEGIHKIGREFLSVV